MRFLALSAVLGWAALRVCGAGPFLFPTANQTLLEQGGMDRFFVGTAGKPWTSGRFGCVRSEGRQMHEGIDIRCLERNRSGEPLDSIIAVADGTVAYVNSRAALSNFGKYIIVRHQIEGLDVYSTYAHLSVIADGVRAGSSVRAGDRIGVMGRTANTKQSISKERAHLHFELNLLLNERFPQWHRQAFPGQRNDHGAWNGQNFMGIDPELVFAAQNDQTTAFSLLEFVRHQPELCRVLVRDASFPWLKRYPLLIRRSPVAERDGAAAYEVALNFAGLPFQLIPRAPSEVTGDAKFQLLSVNDEEFSKNSCRNLVVKRNGRWELGRTGIRLLELLTY